MKVLSVRQPWAWLIVAGHKPVENRGWKTRYRGPILIHAPKQIDSDAIGRLGDMLPTILVTGGIIGMVDLVDIVRDHPNPYFSGPYGWVFENARHLPYMPLRGKLTLFDAPADILEQINATANAATDN